MHIVVSVFYWFCLGVVLVVVVMLVWTAIQVLRGRTAPSPESKEIAKVARDIRLLRKDISSGGKSKQSRRKV